MEAGAEPSTTTSSSESDEELDVVAELQDPKFLRILARAKRQDLHTSDGVSDRDSGSDGERTAPAPKRRKREKPILLKDVAAGEVDTDTEDGPDSRGVRPYAEDLEASRRDFLEAVAAEEDRAGDLFDLPKATVRPAPEARSRPGRRSAQEELDAFFGRDEDLAQEDLFLKKFVSQKGDGGAAEADADRWRPEDDAEDEAHLEAADRFEAAHNFRFEEPGSEAVRTYPRDTEGAVRQGSNRRADARERRKERQRAEKAQHAAEVQRMKNVKRREIEDRLQKIRDHSGLFDTDTALRKLLASANFDDGEYDQAMQQIFGEEYYEAEDDGIVGADEIGAEANAQNDRHVRQGDSSGRAGPAAGGEAAAVQRLMGEYSALDYEDVVAGVPTRFTYRQVDKVDYGLSTEDILTLSDKELNQIVGLKSIATYKQGRGAKKSRFQGLHRLRQLKSEKAEAPEPANEGHAVGVDAAEAKARERRLATYAKPQLRLKAQKQPAVTATPSASGSRKRKVRRARVKQKLKEEATG